MERAINVGRVVKPYDADQEKLYSFRILNALFGPNIPPFVLRDEAAGKAEKGISERCVAGYPEFTYLAVKDEVCKLRTKDVYSFSQIKKCLVKEWKADDTGPHIDESSSFGTE